MKDASDEKNYKEVSAFVAEKLDLSAYVAKWDIADFMECDTFPQLDDAIITRIRNNIMSDAGEYGEYKKMINGRRNRRWFDEYVKEYDSLYYACELFAAIHGVTDFAAANIKALWNKYKDEYYRFDYCYRKFITVFDALPQPDGLVETWHRLLEWDKGQAPSERLAAILLQGEGFTNADPSHPLGGQDGLKDIVMMFEGNKWIAGVYFPRDQQTFSIIKSKFLSDGQGVKKNDAYGFVFFTNQELRLAERTELVESCKNTEVEIYHLERIASLLNLPQNYGVRLEFLDIDMTKEEQVALYSTGMISVDDKLNQLTMDIDECKDLILATLGNQGFDAPRSIDEIAEMANEFCEKIWFDRHLVLREKIESGKETCDPEIWKGALASAERVITKYGIENLSPYSKFDWGMLNGKLSALRWVMGEDWDELYT
jgi:hypothetical protein